MTTTMRATLVLLSASALLTTAGGKGHAASIFDGDPIDPATGLPMILQPGAPRVDPGPDGRYGGPDDIFDPATVGDVDLVLRTGGVFGGGAFPPPAPGIGAAPGAVAGGLSAGGTEIPFDLVASDGAAVPAAGNPLLISELDGHGALVMAFADLDGDGVIGPHGDDGTADDQVERQEIMTPAGRTIALFLAGVAGGSIGVSLGAPASAGGLGVVVVGGAVTGAGPPLFLDGSWVSTRLPLVPSSDPSRILGGNPAPPDPNFLADVELEFASNRHYVPSGDHPVIGAPFAIPLDGSNITVDLARADSGPDAGVALGVPIDVSTYVATPGRRLVPAVGPGGQRELVDASSDVALADDGPGGAIAVYAFAADLLGNPTDPAVDPTTFTVEAGPSLRIVAPDSDGDSSRETLAITGTSAVVLTIDDAGGAGDAAPVDRIIASVGGVPTGSLRITLGGGGPPPPVAWTRAKTVLRVKDLSAGRVRVAGDFVSSPTSIDPAAADVTVTLVDGSGTTIYSRTLPAGTFVGNAQGTSFRYRDPKSAPLPRLRSFTVRKRGKDKSLHKVRLRIVGLDLTAMNPGTTQLVQTVRFGAITVSSTLSCTPNQKATALRCEAQ